MTLESELVQLDALARQTYARMKAADGFPTPSAIALELMRLVNDETSTIEAIADVVKSDPGIASRILRLVNSPSAGVRRRIASIPEAVKLLGMRTLRNLVLGISLVFGQKRVPCAGFAYDLFWSESAGRAVAARHLAEMVRGNGVAPEEAFTCGLLSQIGRLAFATVYRAAYSDVLSRARANDPDGLAGLERPMFDINNDQLAALMMTDWGLPVECCDAVRYQHGIVSEMPGAGPAAVQLARTLHMARSIAVVLVRQEVDLATLNELVNEAGRFGIVPSVFHSAFDSIADEWREMAAILAVSRRDLPPLAVLFSEAYVVQGSMD